MDNHTVHEHATDNTYIAARHVALTLAWGEERVPTCSSAPVQTMQFCRWQPSCTITLSMSTLLMIFTLLPSLHMAPNTLRLMLHLSLHASSTLVSPHANTPAKGQLQQSHAPPQATWEHAALQGEGLQGQYKRTLLGIRMPRNYRCQDVSTHARVAPGPTIQPAATVLLLPICTLSSTKLSCFALG